MLCIAGLSKYIALSPGSDISEALLKAKVYLLFLLLLSCQLTHADALMRSEAVRDVGPAGHFFGTAHTMERYESAFNAPLISNWDNYETWTERGSDPSRKTKSTAGAASTRGPTLRR